MFAKSTNDGEGTLRAIARCTPARIE